MRLGRLLFLSIIVVLTAVISIPALSAESTTDNLSSKEQYLIKTSARPNETRDYNITVNIKGKIPSLDSGSLPTDVNSNFTLKARHKYATRDTDKLMALDITLLSGQLDAEGETIPLTSNLYPKLTALLDSNWNITDIFGIAGTRYASGLPGINFSNMIVLYYSLGQAVPHSVGDKWTSKVTIPSCDETYNFSNTLKSIDTVNGIKAATVQQEITWAPKKRTDIPDCTTKATVLSTFALDTGKLLKTHIECQVTFLSKKQNSNQQEQAPLQANTKIDISLAN